MPDEQREGPAVKHDITEARDRLHQEQDVKAVFIGLRDPLLQLRHALRKWRQTGELAPPDEARQPDGPDQHTPRSVCCKNFQSQASSVTDSFVQPRSCKLTDEEEYREPMQDNARLVEAPAFRRDFYGESVRRF